MISKTLALGVIGTVVLLMAGHAEALQLNPLDFSSLGILNSAGDIVINSDTRELSGGVSFAGILDPASNATVFTFDDIHLSNVSVIGSNPLALLSLGNITLTGAFTITSSIDAEIAAIGTINFKGGSIFVSNGATLTVIGNEILNSGSPLLPRPIPVHGPGGEITITGTPSVPVPPAAWLFGSGLAGLAGAIMRKKRISP